MKIKISQDLLESACLAKHGINLNKTISQSFVKGLAWTIPAAGLVGVAEENRFLLLSILVAGYATYPLINILYQNLYKKECKKEFSSELEELAKNLKTVNIYTNKELLKQAKLIKKDYQIEKGKPIPYLKEKKYIEIETYNEGNKVLLQEHNVGEDEYHISVYNNGKAKKLVLKNQLI